MSRFLEIYHDGDEAILTESISFADAAKASYGLLRKLWETIKTMLRQFMRFVKRIIYKIKGTNPVRIGPLIFDYSAFANGGYGRYESTGRMWNAVQDNFSKFTDQFAQADCDRKALIAEHENIISETRDMQNNMTSTMKICEFSSAEKGVAEVIENIEEAIKFYSEGSETRPMFSDVAEIVKQTPEETAGYNHICKEYVNLAKWFVTSLQADLNTIQKTIVQIQMECQKNGGYRNADEGYYTPKGFRYDMRP